MGVAVPGVIVGVLLTGCGFEHGHLGSGSGGDGGPVPDGVLVPSGHTRMIDIADAEVIGGPHTAFPLLVALNDTWLRDAAHGGDVKNSAGFDIVFSSDRAGTMLLAHELERYAADTGELVAWVKLPTLESSTTLYIHYGDASITTTQENATAVWTGGYAGVWHLDSDLVDIAGGGVATDGGTAQTTGKFGAARSFDGANSYLDIAANVRIDDIFVGGGTAEAWVKANSYGENSRGRIFDKGSSPGAGGTTTTGWLLSFDNYNVAGTALFSVGASTQEGEWNSPASSLPTGNWVHVAVNYDRGSPANVPQLFINGRAQACAPNPTPSGAVGADTGLTLRIGNRTALDRGFDGVIDELRLSKDARSAGWLDTEYRNQNDPASFLTVGPEL